MKNDNYDPYPWPHYMWLAVALMRGLIRLFKYSGSLISSAFHKLTKK